MPAKPITAREEDLLVKGIEKLASLVDEGLHPTEAAIKTAKDMNFNTHMASRMCVAYNTGLQNAQRESSSLVSEKYASFPIANPEHVAERMYGKSRLSEKSASASEEISEAEIEKIAGGAPKPDALKNIIKNRPRKKPKKVDDTDSFELRDNRIKKAMAALRPAYNDLQTRKSEHTMRLKAASGRLYSALKSSGRDVAEAAEYYAGKMYGTKQASALFDIVLEKNMWGYRHQPKRANFDGNPPTLRNMNMNESPMREVQEAVKAASDLVEVNRQIDAYEKYAEDTYRNLVNEQFPGVQTTYDAYQGSEAMREDRSYDEPLPLRKAAVGFLTASMISNTMKPIADQVVGLVKKPQTDRYESALSGLSDPLEEEELSRLQAERVLSDVLLNDEAFSDYDDDQIAEKYREIAALSPEIIRQPMILRPALRRALEGNVQVFEGQQLADAGKSVAQSEVNRAKSNQSRLLSEPKSGLL